VIGNSDEVNSWKWSGKKESGKLQRATIFASNDRRASSVIGHHVKMAGAAQGMSISQLLPFRELHKTVSTLSHRSINGI
jgi:hypothetical protein